MDVLKPGHFDDMVAYGGWFMDTHPPMGVDAPDEPPCIQHHFDHLFPLPLRCYHSRNIANLFFAGRNISATHIAFASTRVMATCAVAGHTVEVECLATHGAPVARIFEARAYAD